MTKLLHLGIKNKFIYFILLSIFRNFVLQKRKEMMHKLKNMIKKYPATSFLIVVIWIICLIPIPENVPLGDVPMMDKWTHFVMYGTLCSVMWWEYLRRHKDKKNAGKLFLLAFLAPIVMSGLIELAQAHLTGGNRSGDWFDFLANNIGVVLGNVIGILLATFRAKGRKGT